MKSEYWSINSVYCCSGGMYYVQSNHPLGKELVISFLDEKDSRRGFSISYSTKNWREFNTIFYPRKLIQAEEF